MTSAHTAIPLPTNEPPSRERRATSRKAKNSTVPEHRATSRKGKNVLVTARSQGLLEDVAGRADGQGVTRVRRVVRMVSATM